MSGRRGAPRRRRGRARRDRAAEEGMKTYSARPSDVQRQWLVVDAEGRTLGRLATQVSMVLRGKHKAIYTPHIDTGDHVVVVNASKVVLTGRKPEDKRYFHQVRMLYFLILLVLFGNCHMI